LPEEVTFVLSYGSTCCIEQSYIFLVLALLRKHAGSWYHFLCGIVTGKQYRYLEWGAILKSKYVKSTYI